MSRQRGGPVATERLSKLPDGRIAYQLRHPWRDGTTHVAFTQPELVEKVTPPPTVSSRDFPALEPVAIPGSQLESFEGVGHYPRCEEPARFVDVLTEFVESTVPARISVAPRHVLRSTGS